MRSRRPAAEHPRAERLRSPLLLTLWVLLAFETVGGLVLFAAYLVVGRRPGETLHVVAGVPLTLVYAVYQWRHWWRVEPIRARVDYILGVTAATVMALTLLSGLALGAYWWQALGRRAGEAAYPAWLSGLHNIGSMLVMAFVGAHLVAVLARDRSRAPV